MVLSPEGEVEVDYQGKAPGRGAWIRPTAEVLRQAEKKPAQVLRALEAPSGRVVDLLERVRASNLRAVLDLLSLASRAGCLWSGADQVRDAAQDPRLRGFLVASDASERAVEAVVSRRPDLPRWEIPLDKFGFGTRIGKGPRAVVAIASGGPTKALIRELRRMVDLR